MGTYGTPLRYPGGKQKLAPFIREVLEKNDLLGGHYAEPYAGGAGVAIQLLLRGDVSHVHLNDICFPVYAFWRSVVYKTEEFCRRISQTPLSVCEWRRQKEVLARAWEFDQVDIGFAFFYLNRCNRSGILNGGLIGGLAQTGNDLMDARFPREALISRVEAISSRHAQISLRNWDAERFILEHASALPERSFVYCDPPYFHKAKRLYLNHYTSEDHERIAKIIQSHLRRPWLISYDCTYEIMQFYRGRRAFTYELQYNARDAYKGKELVVLRDGLRMPKTSSLDFINSALPTIKRIGSLSKLKITGVEYHR